MQSVSGAPDIGRKPPKHFDRNALPDPSLWAGHRDPNRAAMVRIFLRAGFLLASVVLAGFGLRMTTQRLGATRAATQAQLQGIETAGLPAEAQGEKAEKAAKPPVSPAELADLQKSWVGSESMAPRDDKVDPATGERVAPFHGFGLQIDSAPEDARVLVNGAEQGTTPLLTSVDCEPGGLVEVVLERGPERASARTRCRKDTLVKLRLRLTRAAPRR
jgi:hypothetical protein